MITLKTVCGTVCAGVRAKESENKKKKKKSYLVGLNRYTIRLLYIYSEFFLPAAARASTAAAVVFSCLRTVAPFFFLFFKS